VSRCSCLRISLHCWRILEKREQTASQPTSHRAILCISHPAPHILHPISCIPHHASHPTSHILCSFYRIGYSARDARSRRSQPWRPCRVRGVPREVAEEFEYHQKPLLLLDFLTCTDVVSREKHRGGSSSGGLKLKPWLFLNESISCSRSAAQRCRLSLGCLRDRV
jgi:hypothetical protein